MQESKLKKKEREGILNKDNNQEKDRTFWALSERFSFISERMGFARTGIYFVTSTNPITGIFYDGVKKLSRNAEQVVYSLSVYNLIIYIILIYF